MNTAYIPEGVEVIKLRWARRGDSFAPIIAETEEAFLVEDLFSYATPQGYFPLQMWWNKSDVEEVIHSDKWSEKDYQQRLDGSNVD